ncbi:DUF5719 family protein [Streptomyces lycii]|uniref:Secreted protein n=1 Tax=Streptomyces lycii TaxID=2654337 RepID=A0ABQ7FGG4_9ACTN|nr:DUF5719 family protein [Streptomyces lycii]KAF4407405.1 hypothetical protein GCU69_19775 [Streptomyces lycii]
MNRTILSLAGAATALAVITGVAALAAPDGSPGGAPAAAERLPVERSALLCPEPSLSALAETAYTSVTPEGAKGTKGGAELLPAERADGSGPGSGGGDDNDGNGDGDEDNGGNGGKDDKDGARGGDAKPVAPLKEPGKPVLAEASGADAPALIGTADGSVAPGWTVQQTTVIGSGNGRGVLGTSCSPPDTDFWFPAASTAEDRSDYVQLTNPDASAAVVDLELYGSDGRITTKTGEDITVPGRSSVPVLLSTLTEEPVTNVAVHAVARSGRVGASVRAMDDKLGSDWLPSAAAPSGTAVLPGIPADATSVRLVAVGTGERDADLEVRLAGKTGTITPAGHETLTAKSGITTAVDLGDVTKGEPGSLVLSPAEGSEPAPFAVALRVTRGKGDKQETAFIPATGPVEERGTVADNRAKGTTLALTAPGKTAKVKVTASAGSGGGESVSKSYTVKAGTTLEVPEPPAPRDGKGTYALTVEPVSGGPVHAARMLELPEDGVPMFTVQTIPDDRGSVTVPEAGEDLSLLMD